MSRAEPSARTPRRSFMLVLGMAALAWARPAFAGSYLNRSAILLTQALRETEFLRKHLMDKELARVVQQQAQARLKSAGAMLVPSEVTQAHPHLLLALEHHERAADAAVAAKHESFLVERERALQEEQIFRSILRQLGWSLPES